VPNQVDECARDFVEAALKVKEKYLAKIVVNSFDLDLFDVCVSVQTPADSQETSLLASAFPRSRLTESAPWNLVVIDGSAGFFPPNRGWDSRFHQPTGQLRITQDSIRVAVDPIVHTVWVMDKPTKTVLVFVPSLRELPRWWFATPLRLGLSWIADVAGYEFVHGAAIGRDGAGILLAGPSGVGKSTLSLRLALSGWDFLSDDFFLVDGLIAASVYQRAKLNADSLKKLGFEAMAEFSDSSCLTKSIIDVTTLGRVASVPRLTIRGVAVSSLAPFSGVHSVPQSKAFVELASSTLAGLQGGSPQSFARLARVVSGSRLGQFGVMGPIPEISSALEVAMLTA
jgi:hypothetical protein